MNQIVTKKFSGNIGIKETREFIKNIVDRGEFPFKKISLMDVTYFDPVFIGWLALLAKKYNAQPEIIPPKGDEHFKLLQLVPLLDNLKVLTPQYLSKYRIVASTDYSPIFLINKSTFETFFNSSFASTLEKFKEEFQNVRKDFSPKSGKKKNILRSLRNISHQLHNKSKLNDLDTSVLLYYFESLNPLALIRGLADELYGNDEWPNRPKLLGLSTTFENQADYEKYAIEFLKENINHQSPIFIYFFSLYVRNFYSIYGKKSEIKTQEYKEKLINLCTFCMDFYLGTKELAKNIVEHSGEKPNEGEGFIVTRIYNKDKMEKFVKDLKAQSSTNIGLPDDNTKGIFTVYVADKGEKGVINTASDKLQELINSPFHNEQIKDKLKQENKKIDGGEITLKDFYDFYNMKNGFKMFHQQIRSAAGLGLMVFSHLLIRKNKGFMWISSPAKDASGMDNVCVYHKTWRQGGKEILVEENRNELFPMGTSYLFLLPVPSKLDRGKISLKSQRRPKHQTPEGSSVFFDILKKNTYTVANAKITHLPSSSSERLIIEWSMIYSGKDIQKIQSEWNSLSKGIDKFDKPDVIIVLKASKSFDATEIFHTLAMVELVSGTRSIVLYDISDQTIEDFIKILGIYHKAGITLWSENCLTLIIPSDFNSPPFIIGGETLKHWHELNQTTSRFYFYNNNHWLLKLDDLKGGV